MSHNFNKQIKNHNIKTTTKAKVTYSTVKARPTTIKNLKDPRHVGIILFDDNTMNKIRTQSGPLAPSCEYQVHYWAMVLRAIGKETILDICIPTVFFNYKQEVTGARIDFELSDVDDVSEAVKPIHEMKTEELLNDGIIDKLEALLPDEFKFNLMSTNLNSIHKHPGGHKHQAFSGTDLSTSNSHDTGIVFPLSKGELTPNFAGIMAHDGLLNKVAHFEYRIVDGDVKTELNYFRAKCGCLVRADDAPEIAAIPPSWAESLFGIKGSDSVPSKKQNYIVSSEFKDDNKMINDMLGLWENSKFIPTCEFVLPDNVARKSYAPVKYGHNTTINSSNKPVIQPALQSSVMDAWEDMIDLEEDYPFSYQTTKQYLSAEDFGVLIDIEWFSESEIRSMEKEILRIEVEKLDKLYYQSDIQTEDTVSMTEFELMSYYEELQELIIEEIDSHINMDVNAIWHQGNPLDYTQIRFDLEVAGIPDEVTKLSYTEAKLEYKKARI